MLSKRLIALSVFAALAVMPADVVRAQWYLMGSPRPVALTMSGKNFIAGTYRGLFLSTDIGKCWTGVRIGSSQTHVNTLFLHGSN
ncbi:MAG: hypothetical protein Q8913_10675, partial [Bacteroidota bacterium]|nr:hypothetical protein [Bacteroidota bacterium]